MKRLILGILIGLVVALPSGAFAYSEANRPKSPNIIYEIDDESIRIGVFDDADNKCYVAYENRTADSAPAISCIKR